MKVLMKLRSSCTMNEVDASLSTMSMLRFSLIVGRMVFLTRTRV